MSGVRSLTRTPTVKGSASAAVAPIYVDSDDNRVKVIPGGSGSTTEIILQEAGGAASYEAASGRYAPVWFHKWVRPWNGMRMSDYLGLMLGGRLLALECKHRQWKRPSDLREHEQAAFLDFVRHHGGIGAFVKSAEEVECLLR